MSKSNQEVMTVILAGGNGDDLSVLSENRSIPAVPFGGKFRIIDFTLSNCVNSGIYNIMVLTQYQPLSLHDHIRNGKPWDLDRIRGGIRIVSPYIGRREAGWDRGTADAVYQNIEEIEESESDTVLILAGDHIYKMDYRPMIDFHQGKKADVTMGVLRLPLDQAHRFGVVRLDDFGRVRDFKEKPEKPASNLVSMGIYVFSKEALVERLSRFAAEDNDRFDFGRHILPRMIAQGDKVFAYPFDGYWRDVGTVQAYWDAHMELLSDPPAFDLYDRDWLIYTRSEERPPAVIGAQASIEDSLISHGCQIRGQVIHSILSPGVVVEQGAIVRNSIIMVDSVVGANSVVTHAIIDKEVQIGSDCRIGLDQVNTTDAVTAGVTSGLTIIGKRASLPDDMHIGRDCVVEPGARPEDFTGLELANGQNVQAKVAAG